MGGKLTFILSIFLISSISAAKPSPLRKKATSYNSVVINGVDSYCLVVPKDFNTDVGASEYPGGTTVYCSQVGRVSDAQGLLADDFWKNVTYMTGTGSNGGRYVQLTGCINPFTLDRLNADDPGGQYDSSGGIGGNGNPAGSVCTGYNHYVEVLEPAGPRACIRCCDNPADCPTNRDTSGCPNVIPGNYFDCV